MYSLWKLPIKSPHWNLIAQYDHFYHNLLGSNITKYLSHQKIYKEGYSLTFLPKLCYKVIKSQKIEIPNTVLI